jgi:hypothetical protein
VSRRLDDVAQEFKEALAVHTIFEAFGIGADDIYVVVATDHLQVIARQGGREFVVDVASKRMGPAAEIAQAWRDAVGAYNAAPRSERRGMTERTAARANAVLIIGAMVAKGLRGPGDELAS